MKVLLVIGVVSSALTLGALWAVLVGLSERLRGILLAFSGGALITSLAFELVEPARDEVGTAAVAVWLLTGALVFTAVDYLVDEVWSSRSGLGIATAVVLDGVPENMALGAALIDTPIRDVAALATAIFVSNLPEAAGGAHDLVEGGWSRLRVVALWTATAALLSAAAIGGFVTFQDAEKAVLAPMRAVAAGALVASLVTELFPKAFDDADQLSGIAVAVGFVLTLAIS